MDVYAYRELEQRIEDIEALQLLKSDPSCIRSEPSGLQGLIKRGLVAYKRITVGGGVSYVVTESGEALLGMDLPLLKTVVSLSKRVSQLNSPSFGSGCR